MIEVHNLQDGYRYLCYEVLRGDDVWPRGLCTRELLGTTIKVWDITRSLPLHIGRKCNPAIGAVEAIQLIGGFSDPDLTCKIAPNMKQFLTDGRYFHGAYGPRIRGQVQLVVSALRADRDTRQAVANIWHWQSDLGINEADLPCTLTLHFLIRKNKLILHTHMRSNDVWWGLAYDVFQFTQLQLTVAHMLGIETGCYYHHTTSLHIYERDWDKVDELEVVPQQIMPSLWGFSGTDRAWRVGHGLDITEPTDTERWYQTQLGPHLDVSS
jgi:thymidylate synthase